MMGMTDLQFKSYLKHLLARLEKAEKLSTEEPVKEEIKELMKDLREDLQG